MASKKDRDLCNWRHPFGALCRCYLVIMFRREGLRGQAGAKAMLAKMPYFYEMFAEEQRLDMQEVVLSGQKPTLVAIGQRLDKGIRYGYENEHPEKNPRMRQYWEPALKVYQSLTILSIPEIRQLLLGANTVSTEDILLDTYLYVAKRDGALEQAKIGICEKPNSRIKQLQLDVEVSFHALFKTTRKDAFALESWIKSVLNPGGLKGEWRPTPPEVMSAMVAQQLTTWNVQHQRVTID